MGVVVAGCGGSSRPTRPGPPAPTGVRAGLPGLDGRVLDPNIDESSTAWKQLLAVGARFPSWPKLVTKFNAEANDATDDGPTLAQLRSWLGSELAFGVLDVPTGGADPKVLGFADVRDKAQLEAALKGEGHARAGDARRVRPLRQRRRHVRRDLRRHGADLDDRPAAEAAIDRLAGTGDRLPT